MKFIRLKFNMKYVFYTLVLSTLLLGCKNNNTKLKLSETDIVTVTKDSFIIYTSYSKLKNSYVNFDSPKAVNCIADIENEYFNSIEKSYSKYYGTAWETTAIYHYLEHDSTNEYGKYIFELLKKGIKPDSMHCTIYAVRALKAGLGNDFLKFEKYHKRYWGKREYAGWSVAFILTKYFKWNAYLMISKSSNEYNVCKRNYGKDRSYHVWKQPNIPIKKVFDFDTEKKAINILMKQNEFGWGFSDQGWHTWITRFDTLKECNWAGAPSKLLKSWTCPLFVSTKFTNFYDYQSHIVVFPPKK